MPPRYREKEPEDPSLLTRGLTAFERPGFAVRSALRLDLPGAARNLFRMPLDVVGLLDPTQVFPVLGLGPSASNRAITGLGLRDLPTPEMSDITKSWGIGRPSEGFDRFAFDAAGGFFTNPLNLVGGEVGLGKGAVSAAARGIGPWAGRVVGGEFVGGLGRQAAVAGLLESALTPKGWGALQASRLRLLQGPQRSQFGQLVLAAARPGARGERASLWLKQRALEEAMSAAAGRRLRLSNPEQAELGAEALAKAGLLQRPGWTFAGQRVADAPWGRLALGRPDSVAAEAGASRARRALWDAVDVADAALQPILSPIRGVYDKTLIGSVPQALRRAAHQSKHLDALTRTEGERFTTSVSTPAMLQAPAETQAAVRVMLEAADQARRNVVPSAQAQQAALAQIQHPLARKLADAWWKVAPKQREELLTYGGRDLQHPLYVPRQAKEAFRPYLELTGPAAGAALRRPKHEPLADYLNALGARAQGSLTQARAAGKPIPLLEEWAARGSDPWDLVETDPRILFSNRWNEHARDLSRAALQQTVEREVAAGRARPGTALDEWLKPQIESLPPREGAQKLLANANYHLKRGLYAIWPASHMRNAASAALQAWSDESIGGIEAARIFVRSLYEGPLIQFTQHLPAGERGIFLKAASGGPGWEAARAQAGRMRIGRHSGEAVLRALDSVTGSGGPLDIALDPSRRMATGLATPVSRSQRVISAGFGAGIGGLAAGPVGAAVGAPLGAAVGGRAADLGYRVAAGLEDSFRRQHLLALISKGVEPTEAVQRVSRAFVDYAEQGKLDRWLRDLFLFSRYSVGVVPPTVRAALLKPRTVGIPAALQRAGGGDEVEQQLPAWQRGQLALRVPGTRYVATQFGTPLEAASQSLERFTSPEAFRKGVLGGLTPPARLPAEIVTGVSFFSGRPWASFRKAPDWAPDALTDERRGQREVPGEWLELLRATPFSRFSATAPELVRALSGEADPRRGGPAGTLLSNLTGLRLERPDPEAVRRRQVRETLEKATRAGDVAQVAAWYPRRADLPPEVEAALAASRERR